MMIRRYDEYCNSSVGFPRSYLQFGKLVQFAFYMIWLAQWTYFNVMFIKIEKKKHKKNKIANRITITVSFAVAHTTNALCAISFQLQHIFLSFTTSITLFFQFCACHSYCELNAEKRNQQQIFKLLHDV